MEACSASSNRPWFIRVTAWLSSREEKLERLADTGDWGWVAVTHLYHRGTPLLSASEKLTLKRFIAVRSPGMSGNPLQHLLSLHRKALVECIFNSHRSLLAARSCGANQP